MGGAHLARMRLRCDHGSFRGRQGRRTIGGRTLVKHSARSPAAERGAICENTLNLAVAGQSNSAGWPAAVVEFKGADAHGLMYEESSFPPPRHRGSVPLGRTSGTSLRLYALASFVIKSKAKSRSLLVKRRNFSVNTLNGRSF